MKDESEEIMSTSRNVGLQICLRLSDVATQRHALVHDCRVGAGNSSVLVDLRFRGGEWRGFGRCQDPCVARFYRLVRLVLDVLVLRCRSDRSKDVDLLVLRHQLTVLHRQHPRPRFTPEDRAILTALSPVVRRDRWAIFMVKPDMLLRWHRRLVAKHWTYPHQPGRPTTTLEIRRTILCLARENPTWGYRRIHGELTQLGIHIAASTVCAILKRAGIDPAPGRNSDSWTTFLRSPSRPNRRL
jgi:hypothetical protein